MWLWDTPEHPHVVSLLAHILPHHNDEISVAEMRTILTLSGMRAREKAHQHRKIIPVSCNMVANTFFFFFPIAPKLILKKSPGHCNLCCEENSPRRGGHPRQREENVGHLDEPDHGFLAGCKSGSGGVAHGTRVDDGHAGRSDCLRRGWVVFFCVLGNGGSLALSARYGATLTFFPVSWHWHCCLFIYQSFSFFFFFFSFCLLCGFGP